MSPRPPPRDRVAMALVASRARSPFLPRCRRAWRPHRPARLVCRSASGWIRSAAAPRALGVLAARRVRACASRVPPCSRGRGAAGSGCEPSSLLAVAAHAVVLLGLPLVFSRDVYSYIAYGRIAGLYGANPYVRHPIEFPADPILCRWWGTDGWTPRRCTGRCSPGVVAADTDGPRRSRPSSTSFRMLAAAREPAHRRADRAHRRPRLRPATGGLRGRRVRH